MTDAARKLLLLHSPFSHLSPKPHSNFFNLHPILSAISFSTPINTIASSAYSTIWNCKSRKKVEKKSKEGATAEGKRRTRSDKEFDEEAVLRYGDSATHIPVMLGEVLDVFGTFPLRSFVDCTLGAAGHSTAVNSAERGFSVLSNGPLDMRMNPQASLKAEDILNSWPDNEVGRILRDYGEESNWYSLQNKILKARQMGGLHSTGDLVHLIQSSTSRSKGGRQGWIKTVTRVFQALRIAVNDELNTLKETLYACFDCLATGGRLAVISFHSLEDRIVKQTFLDIINDSRGDDDDEQDEKSKGEFVEMNDYNNDDVKETWIRRRQQGLNGTILTKRPITPSEQEERLNRRCRSAKLRVIQKL